MTWNSKIPDAVCKRNTKIEGINKKEFGRFQMLMAKRLKTQSGAVVITSKRELPINKANKLPYYDKLHLSLKAIRYFLPITAI